MVCNYHSITLDDNTQYDSTNKFWFGSGMLMQKTKKYEYNKYVKSTVSKSVERSVDNLTQTGRVHKNRYMRKQRCKRFMKYVRSQRLDIARPRQLKLSSPTHPSRGQRFLGISFYLFLFLFFRFSFLFLWLRDIGCVVVLVLILIDDCFCFRTEVLDHSWSGKSIGSDNLFSQE